MRSRFAGYPSRSVITSKAGPRGTRRQENAIKPTKSAMRRSFEPKPRQSRNRAGRRSFLRGSITRSGSVAIRLLSVSAVLSLVHIERADDLAHQMMAHDVALVQIDEG